jgi:hypothetical protein
VTTGEVRVLSTLFLSSELHNHTITQSQNHRLNTAAHTHAHTQNVGATH